uniref:C-type lectin domain-containing protein n=1 Tax=Apteryx owenii TaxID=8824 RepID=A0A8B9PHP5_APTOW
RGRAGGGCLKGWLDFRGNCYGYFRQELPWRKAEAWCRVVRAGCHLASIHTSEEHKAMAKFISQSDPSARLSPPGHPIPAPPGPRPRPRPRTGTRSPGRVPQQRSLPFLFAGFLSWENDSCGERKAFICKYAA